MTDVEERGFWVEGFGSLRKVRMTKLYNVWSSMRSRCRNPRHHAFSRYGGRGISICAEWDDFSTFRKWAIESGYETGLYLDRVDNDSGYSADNCRWVTPASSVRNRSVAKLCEESAATIKKESGTNAEIARRHRISREHVRDIKSGKRWSAA